MPDPIERSTTLALALSYAAAGLRVLPILPNSKRPPMREWTEAATTNPDVITSWYTYLYGDHGIGLAMGRQPDGRFIFALDVDEHDPAHSGNESLAELERTYGSLPATVRSLTGSSGLHLLFEAPVEVRNGVAGDGLDVRGEGGQIVVAPSIHPVTGRRYAWEDTFAPWEHAIARTPGWLLDLVLPHSPPPSMRPSVAPRFSDPDHDTGSSGEWLRERWDWAHQLRDAGWVEHHTDRTGDTHWTRPGKPPREGASAVLHVGGPLVVFSTDHSMSGLRSVGRVNSDGSVSVSPLDFYAAMRHGGDLRAAGRAIRLLMDPADSRLSAEPDPDPRRRKLKATKASAIPVLRVQWLWDGRIAAGTLALLAGSAGLGKSTLGYWLAARVTRGELEGEDWKRPRSVLVCATEDSWEHTITPRLMAHDADLDRVVRLEVELDGSTRAELSLPADLTDVEVFAGEMDASLLLLDPLMSRLDAKLDTHRDAEVRQALEPLVNSLVRSKLACVGVIHHNKSGSTNPLDLVMASTAFGAVARSVHTVVADPTDEAGSGRMFGTTKNNLGRMDLPVRTFTVDSWSYPTSDGGVGEVGRLRWGADATMSIQSALNTAADNRKPALGAAIDWLRTYMTQHGPRVNSSDAIKAGDKAGHSTVTLGKARHVLGIESEDARVYGPRNTAWFYPADRQLSADDPDPPPSLKDIT